MGRVVYNAYSIDFISCGRPVLYAATVYAGRMSPHWLTVPSLLREGDVLTVVGTLCAPLVAAPDAHQVGQELAGNHGHDGASFTGPISTVCAAHTLLRDETTRDSQAQGTLDDLQTGWQEFWNQRLQRKRMAH
ncbi:hypothetical protein AB0I75_11435 [Streptomyces sp. NPDC050273]|uniref:hypothetical protein n=1 Tax=Streptomyces sp. NPDC050273 TaxID=3154933 RepID=UPI00341C529A